MLSHVGWGSDRGLPWPQNLCVPLSPCFVGSLQWEGEEEVLGTPSSVVAGLGHLGLILCGAQQGTAASRGEACTCASSIFSFSSCC